MLKNPNRNKIIAKTDYFFKDPKDPKGKTETKEIEVEIIGVDPVTRQFQVINETLNIQTLRYRAHLCLTTDHKDFVKTMKDSITKNRAEAQ